MRAHPLRDLRRRLAILIVAYCILGAASQKLVPGVDEIFPFSGWSLFSKVPHTETRYSVLILRHDGRPVDPPVSLLQAPGTMVTGNRYTARKLIQRLGRAHDRGEAAEVARLRALLEGTHLQGRVRYELRFERYRPLEKWRTGANDESRSLAKLRSGGD